MGTDTPVFGRFESGSVRERQVGLIQNRERGHRGKTNTKQERWCRGKAAVVFLWEEKDGWLKKDD